MSEHRGLGLFCGRKRGHGGVPFRAAATVQPHHEQFTGPQEILAGGKHPDDVLVGLQCVVGECVSVAEFVRGEETVVAAFGGERFESGYRRNVAATASQRYSPPVLPLFGIALVGGHHGNVIQQVCPLFGAQADACTPSHDFLVLGFERQTCQQVVGTGEIVPGRPQRDVTPRRVAELGRKRIIAFQGIPQLSAPVSTAPAASYSPLRATARQVTAPAIALA
jgi:hypothetical protein